MPYKNPQDKLAWRQANRDKAAEYRHKWLATPVGQVYLEKQKALREKQKQANAEKRLAKRLANIEIKRKERALKDRAYRLRQRAKAMTILGNVCIACGMDDPDVLEFDHIEPILRKTTGVRSKDVYYEVIRHENPLDIFQLLCANCHAKKTRSNKEFLGNTPIKGTVKND